jgi:pilus assembly protein CpaE
MQGALTTTVGEIFVITADPELAECVRSTFADSGQFGCAVVNKKLSAAEAIDCSAVAVLIADLDGAEDSELAALERIVGRSPVLAVAVAGRFDEAVVRRLMRMRVADFLVKPVSPLELIRACAQAAESRIATEVDETKANEAEIFTFLPAVGGAGVTTLAVETSMVLLESAKRGKKSVCLVDLDFQHGACADYLDIEPRLDLGEIEPRPERLDRQLLEIMLSYHSSGLAVVAAPNRPAEMRSFEPLVVTRLLDLVSSHFDFVVFDTPRTWFSWTDNVLLGSDKVFIVSETTVPSLRQARQLVAAIRDRLGERLEPQIVVNRFEQRMFSSGLRRTDIEKAIGASLAALIPNHYALVRESIDRGVPLSEVKPGNPISAQLKKFICPKISSAPNTAPATADNRAIHQRLLRGARGTVTA